MIRATFTGDPVLLDSAAAVAAAVADGSVNVDETDIVVNYPTVKWPGGELPVEVHVVSWNVPMYPLTSYDAIMAAHAAGDIDITRVAEADFLCPIQGH